MTRGRLILALCVGLSVWLASGCTAVQWIPDRDSSSAYLRLDVEPDTTQVFIDSHYRGVVKGWVQQTVPVPGGERRVELRADGYMTRRFDINLAGGELVTLRVSMERSLDDMN